MDADELTVEERRDAAERMPARLKQFDHGILTLDEMRALLRHGCLPEYADATDE